MEWIIIVALFLGTVCLAEGTIFVLRKQFDPSARAIRRRLDELAATTYEEMRVDITRKGRALSHIPQLHDFLVRIPVIHRLDKLVVQADVTQPVGFFILLTPLLFLCGFVGMLILAKGYLFPLLCGIGASLLPFFYLTRKKQWRMGKFEQQLPDALDLMARSLRAGHAFSGGLQMVAEEFGAPVGPEFHRVMNEINYGGSVDQALKSLADRIDVDDLKFFTVSVIIQRESGGNLAEILESIASLIRERFKLQGKVKALSAEGKLSAIILVGLPFVVAFILFLINPGYVRVLNNDPAGRILVLIALMMMACGVLMIRKMIQIRV